MFDFAWSEIGVIAVAALIFIGPKDMPVAIKAVTGAIKKARRMASEFQTHVDELVREADLQEVRDHIGTLRNFNIGRTLEKLVDEDGTIRRSFDDPLAAPSLQASPATASESAAAVEVAERPEIGVDAVAAPDPAPEVRLEPERIEAPAFIPPALARRPDPRRTLAEPPAFIPPEIARAASPPSHAA